MTTLQVDQEPTSPNSPLSPDSCLYCHELSCTDDNDGFEQEQEQDYSTFLEDDEQYFLSLLSKEKDAHFSDELGFDASKSLMAARMEILEWMVNVSSYHNFSAVTLVLGVCYFDGFIFSVGFQRERPWMVQLAAVACLALASKFEETHVPLALELQLDSKYIFEAKTIKRMELLILSTLEWKMNAVTPLSYFGIFVRRFKLKGHHHWDVLCRCETLILSAIQDSRYLHYVPSVLAAAAMVQTLKELGLGNPIEYQSHLTDTFKLNKRNLEDCCKFIQEISSKDKAHKRKYCTSGDTSPSAVLDIGFSESSEESISVLFSPVPKKCRTLECHS